MLLRVGLAAIVLNLIIIAGPRRYPRGAGMLGRYIVMALSNNVLPFVLIVFATARIGAGSASILNATTPIFALIVAHFATVDEKITPGKLVGILLGFGGVAAMTDPGSVSGLGVDYVAVAAMLGASLCYGFAAVHGRGFKGIDPLVSAACQLTASTFMLTPLALAFDRPFELPLPGPVTVASVIGLALLSTALAYVIFYRLIARAGGTNTSLVTLLIPVGGVFLAWALLGEAFTPAKAAGMTLIGLGLVTIDGRVFARMRRPQPARPSGG